VPFKGDGAKLLDAHRYGEMNDALRRDRNAYGPITDYQVACVRSGQELWELLHLNKQVFKDRKPRLAFPVLKTLSDIVEATISDFSVGKGQIEIQVRMRDGSTATISQATDAVEVAQLVELAKLVSRDDDPNAHVRYGNVYALQGEIDSALTSLLRARQLGATVENAIDNVVEAACVTPAGAESAADLTKHRTSLEGLLERHGQGLPDGARARLEAAIAAIRKQMAAAETDGLLRQAEAAAQKKQFREAYALAEKLIKEHPESKAAAAARALLKTLPHPDGRLLNGFETAEDMRGAAKSANAEFERVTDPALVKEGEGALRIRMSRPAGPPGPAQKEGSIAGFRFDPTSFARVKSISFWVRALGDSAGPVNFNCYSTYTRAAVDYYFTEFRLDKTWRQVRLPVSSFVPEGSPTWNRIFMVSFTYFGTAPVEFLVDGIRLQED
jgi:uncharacterized protein YicC (UPF0701 family)